MKFIHGSLCPGGILLIFLICQTFQGTKSASLRHDEQPTDTIHINDFDDDVQGFPDLFYNNDGKHMNSSSFWIS